jgi:hypothetical protein
MRFFIFIFPILAVQATVMVRSLSQGGIRRTCSTPPPSAEMLELYQEMSLQPRDTPRESIEVATYFHLVSAPDRKSWVGSRMLANQVCNLRATSSGFYLLDIASCHEQGLLTAQYHLPSP